MLPYLPAGSRLGLDTEALVVVDDNIVENLHVANGHIGVNGADRDAMSTGAAVSLEDDVRTLVDCKAVVLVVDNAVFNR